MPRNDFKKQSVVKANAIIAVVAVFASAVGLVGVYSLSSLGKDDYCRRNPSNCNHSNYSKSRIPAGGTERLTVKSVNRSRPPQRP